MKIRIILAVVAIWLIVSGCGNSEKDFVGTYRSFYVTKVVLPSGGNVFGALFGAKSKQPVTGKEFFDVGDIGVDLFLDQSGKEVRGEAVIVAKRVKNAGFGPQEVSEKMNFDITNLRLSGDTLVGNLENEVLRLSGKKIKFIMARNSSVSVVGIGKDIGIENSGNNPLFVSSNSEVSFFKCLEDAGVKSEKNVFFEKQKKELAGKIDTEKDQDKKQVLKNSLLEVSSRMK